MSTHLFAHLDSTQVARAKSISLFADEQRLARKPRCGWAKDFSHIRTAPLALTHTYIQPNSPVAYIRVVLDLDWYKPTHRFHELPLRYLAEANAWKNELGLPAPNWAALSRDKNGGHICYELETPVGRHENARIRPQRYLAAIEEAYSKILGSDEGFNGQLCKNPLNPHWDFYKGPDRARDLNELADYVNLEEKQPCKYNRTPRGEIGRNVYLFDEIRFWAYDNINAYRSGIFENWEKTVVAMAEHMNSSGYNHLPDLDQDLLPFSECKSIGKSVARWVWTNHGQQKLTVAFSELQAWRGSRGAAAAAKVKRERREEQILAAIGQITAQGQMPTINKVAGLIGCAKSTLSKHYNQFFQGTPQ